VLVVVVAGGGVDAVPKYTAYDVAPVEAFQVKEGASRTLLAPFAGDTNTGAAGGAVTTVRSVAPPAAAPPRTRSPSR